MSSGSNDNNGGGAALVFGLFIAVAYIVFLAIVFGLVILAVAFTVLSIVAWNRPLRIHKWVLTPAEARAFIKRGLFWMFATPVAFALLDIFTALALEDRHFPLLMMFGYTFGSVVLEYLLYSDGESERRPLIEYLPPESTPRRDVLPAPTPENSVQPAPAPPPFRFASWDDEER